MKQNIEQKDDQGLNPFSDIISNLLGTLMVVVLVMFLMVGVVEREPKETQQDPQKSVPFLSPKRNAFRPWDNVYVVAENRVAFWDVEKVVELFQKQKNRSKVVDGDSSYYLLDQSYNRDIDYFLLKKMVDWEAFKTNNRPLVGREIDDWTAIHLGRAAKQGRSMSFFVYPSGMNLFNRIYLKLAQEKVKFRWVIALKEHSLALFRSTEQFDATKYFLQ